MNWELGTFGMWGSGGGGVDLLSVGPVTFGFSVVGGVVCVVVVELVVVVGAAVTPSFLRRIFSSHSSQPCLGLFKLRC